MLRLNQSGYDLILQVHDELVFEVSEQEQENAMKVIAKCQKHINFLFL